MYICHGGDHSKWSNFLDNSEMVAMWAVRGIFLTQGWSQTSTISFIRLSLGSKFAEETHTVQSCISGWWLSHPSEKYEFVSWDDFPFPTEWKNNPNVPNHQPDMSCICLFSFVQNSMGIKHSSIVSHRPPETSGFAASTPRLDPAVFLTVFLWVSKYPNLMSWSWVTLR